MEPELPKSAKPSYNVAGIFHRFTTFCKLTSVSISSSSERVPTVGLYGGDRSAEETDCGDEARDSKIHPQPCEETATVATGEIVNLVARKLFELISSLKSAYIQLQEAHIPYNPEKLRFADQLVVSNLESLSEIEHLYLENRSRKLTSLCALKSEVEKQHRLLENLQSQVQRKDTEILGLKWQIEEVDMKNAEMEEELKLNRAPHVAFLPLDQQLNASAFSLIFESTARSIHDFAKPLIALMKASGWDLDRAAGASTGGSVVYGERSHKKYAFEAYISRRMFGSDGLTDAECLGRGSADAVMRFQDPFDAVVEDPNSGFARFCRMKYLSVVHPAMEASFFGNLDQREFVSGGGHPRTPLYRAFAKMARGVWVLRVMASLMAPKGEIFCAPRGCEFTGEHMESVVEVEGDGRSWNVGFTVVPGFYRVGNGVAARCRVYLTREKEKA